MGVTIKAATSYAQANEIVENEKIDIIVINLDHESIQPIQICKHFKSTSEIPVVLTSVQSFPKKVKSMSQGADLLVEQPIPRQFFIEKIRNLLEQKVRTDLRLDLPKCLTYAISELILISCLASKVRTGTESRLLSILFEPFDQRLCRFWFAKVAKPFGRAKRDLWQALNQQPVGTSISNSA